LLIQSAKSAQAENAIKVTYTVSKKSAYQEITPDLSARKNYPLRGARSAESTLPEISQEDAAPVPALSLVPVAPSDLQSDMADTVFIRARSLYEIKPQYPLFAVRRGIEGQALIDAEIDSSGNAKNVDIYISSGHMVLDKAALECVKDARFIPASYLGKPVSDTLRIAVNFSLK